MTLVLSDKITAAVRDENIKELEKLTSEQANGTSTRFMRSGRPVIFDANSSKIIKLLVKNGANVNCEDSGFPPRSPLYSAIKTGKNIHVISALIESGANVNYHNGCYDSDYPQSILGTAIFYRRWVVFNYLKKQGAEFFDDKEESEIHKFLYTK